MKQNRDVGIAAPLQVKVTDLNVVIWGGSLLTFPCGQHMGGKRSDFQKNQEIFWANGCCMLLCSSMIKEIGMLDANMCFINTLKNHFLRTWSSPNRLCLLE
ncbi:hypothetical protein [Collimonas humicola]|uniref:hypothetical protein n=1 Tax=Collimonas humicola TaxID=2825886 RepID=UPI001B8D873C|nr:hypothetical protein [Collimonas humicola]